MNKFDEIPSAKEMYDESKVIREEIIQKLWKNLSLSILTKILDAKAEGLYQCKVATIENKNDITLGLIDFIKKALESRGYTIYLAKSGIYGSNKYTEIFANWDYTKEDKKGETNNE